MSVYKRGDTYWFEFVFRGQRIRESTKQPNKRVAEQMEAARKTQLAKGEVGLHDRKVAPAVRVFAERFRDAIRTLCADKPATVEFYESKLDRLLEYEPLASAALDRVDEEMVEAYRQQRARQISHRGGLVAVASVNRELATLRRMLRLAQEWKVIDRVPRVRLGRGEKVRDFVLSYEQEPLYLGAVGQDLHDVAVLLLDTGLRVGEALSLEWTHVRLEPAQGAKLGFVTVRARYSKNSKPRNVPLTARGRDMLERRRKDRQGPLVFQTNGEPLYQTWLNQQHAKARTLLKLPADFVLHSLRHTYGTRLGESGTDAFTIMKLMGHSSVTVSQRYVHPSPEAVERAVERLDAMNRAGSGSNQGRVEDTHKIPTSTKRTDRKKPISS